MGWAYCSISITYGGCLPLDLQEHLLADCTARVVTVPQLTTLFPSQDRSTKVFTRHPTCIHHKAVLLSDLMTEIIGK